MVDRDVLGSGKTLRVGEVDWVLVEDGKVVLTCPDFVIETRRINGTMQISFGSTRIECGRPEVVICARMRMDLVFAQILRNVLDGMIKDALQPPEKEKAN